MRQRGVGILWVVFLVAIVLAFTIWNAVRADSAGEGPAYREPVVLSSEKGVLEVVLTARQGEGQLDTVKEPVQNMLLFGYRVVRGKASNGQNEAQNLYPGPTIRVSPGDTLIVHLENQMIGLSIEDFFDPAYTAAGGEIPLTPPPIANPPFNLHTHGLHVSPMGNSDNVLLSLPAGARNTYRFDLPKDHPQGLYWYHGHLHTMTTAQTYAGLSGLLVVGRADGNLPAVSQNALPIRTMALQYNVVYDRQGGARQLNNPNWPQFVSTLRPPKPGEVEAGNYRPLLSPVNFAESKPGTRFITNWWAGPLDIDNHRGQFELIPNNLMEFEGDSGETIPAQPTLPDRRRDVQFTVNGQFQPYIASRPGQTEIWVLANVSDLAYMRVRLTETATGRHPQLILVGQDGLPYPEVQVATEEEGTVLSIPPASRYALAVTIPEKGDLVLEMPPMADTKTLYQTPGVLYTSRGGGKAPTGRLGKVRVDNKYISYFDGFFIFPTQSLLRAGSAENVAPGQTVVFKPGQALGAHTSFVDTAKIKPDVRRELLINGGFLDDGAHSQEAKAFIYAFDGKAFPHTPLLRPRLDSVEEWTFVNHNNDEHPIHIHVNDFQVTEISDPVSGFQAVNQRWGQDNVNVPAPLLGPREAVVQPGKVALRTKFQDFLGSYVLHCHRLNHEDNGLMAMVNVIPKISTVATSQGGLVTVRDAENQTLLAKVRPFPDFSGEMSVAMGDLDGDAVLDLVVATGAGTTARVAAYSGAGAKPFSRELARFEPFTEKTQTGLKVAVGGLEGNGAKNNIVIGSGPGQESRVLIFSSRLPALGKRPAVVGSFSPYPGQKSGVEVAVGMVECASGLHSVITAPGPGQPSLVKVFRYEVENPEFCTPESGPSTISEFLAYDRSYKGGVSLACDWLSAAVGGAQMVVTGQRSGSGEVRAFSTGSALDGFPEMYTQSPTHHSGPVSFRKVLEFAPFSGGVAVATSSTTDGADLWIQSGDGEPRRYTAGRAHPNDDHLTATRRGK